MSNKRLVVEIKISDKKAVKIERDKYSLSLLTIRNGLQWSGCTVDEDMLDTIVDCIGDYKKAVADEQ